MTSTPVELTSVKIDGVEVSVPKGTLIIRAAEQAGITIPRFCDHPLLKPVGACRQCLVEVAMPDREGVVRPMPKPQPSCAMTVTPGMEVKTQESSEVAAKAQHGIMEYLLINHPLDCPVCDKAGECPLQNQAMTTGRVSSRFQDVKRTYPKPVKITEQILLDRDRCILCQRCTRFSAEIAGDPFIALQMRGSHSQIGAFDENILEFTPLGEKTPCGEPLYSGPGGKEALAATTPGPLGESDLDLSGRPFASYFSGNIVQICPVGALTSAKYRFRSRPFDLKSTDSVTEHDASGSAIRVDVRRNQVVRRQAGECEDVNREWITDKDRFAFAWQQDGERINTPLVRDEDGELVPTSWSDAMDVAGRGLLEARGGAGVGLLPGGRLTLEDSYAWSKFARVALNTNDIDHRARFASPEEQDFLGHAVAGTGLGVTYAEAEKAGFALLVALEPEDECGALFLRLRSGVLNHGLKVATVAPWATRGTQKLNARLLPAAPGTEPEMLAAMDAQGQLSDVAQSLGEPGAVILVGERAAAVPGTLSAVVRLAQRTGARIAWVPRRAGERGAVDAGTLPGLLPGGRPVSSAQGRVDTAAVWGCGELPVEPGRSTPEILGDLVSGELDGLLIGGVEIDDLPDPQLARAALAAAKFVVQVEVSRTEVSEYADVVLPAAPPSEKPGTYVNWEGRMRPFGQVLVSRASAEMKTLDSLARELGADLGLGRLADAHRELEELANWDGERLPAPEQGPGQLPEAGPGEALVASWKLSIDGGSCLRGDQHLLNTARRPVARMSPLSASQCEISDGDTVRVTGPAGELTLPVVVTEMPDNVVWIPTNAQGASLALTGAQPGTLVRLSQEVAK